jgi:hypothetical protein
MGANGNIGLQGAAGAHAHDAQGNTLFQRPGLPGNKVDIDQRVELIDQNINVVGAHAGGNDRQPLAFIVAHVGHEFALVNLGFDGIEMLTHQRHALRVADGNDGIGNVVGQQVQMVNATVAVDDQLRFGNRHGWEMLRGEGEELNGQWAEMSVTKEAGN